jgi:flagellar protein FlaI
MLLKSNFPHLLARIVECVECKHACLEKGLCAFAEEEMRDVVALSSRIFSKDVDTTLQLRYELFTKINAEIAVRATLATVGLQKIADLVEDEVEDILLVPGRPIYVTKRSGKFKTSKTADGATIKSLLKLAQMKGIELTTANPSFRYGLRFGKIRMRISLDLPPIVPNPQAYIRIHRGKITLRQLMESGFLTREQLAEIFVALKEGRHIVVAGPPGSGKTTLLAALDDVIPGNLQRVYIDEADEFVEDLDKNQIKIRDVNKARQIYASLNRNIDLVFIGELQYEDHFHAFKTATEMGLQTFATMHSATVEEALRRLERYTEVKNTAIIQLAKRYGAVIERRVVEIYVK